jgi:DNA-binding response OmpR family regulator
MNEGNVLPFEKTAVSPPRVPDRLPIILTKLTGSSRSDPLGRTTSPRRILIVDDDADGAVSLAMLLTMVGHEITTAHDGLEAIDAGGSFEPHIVLLDLDLPKLNGYDVCRRMRAANWGSQALIVAVTGWSDDAHRMEALAAGFDMHLVKPVSAEVFMTVLAAAS